jgi:hypothetical protein
LAETESTEHLFSNVPEGLGVIGKAP